MTVSPSGTTDEHSSVRSITSQLHSLIIMETHSRKTDKYVKVKTDRIGPNLPLHVVCLMALFYSLLKT
jgi:hypothetical protein